MSSQSFSQLTTVNLQYNDIIITKRRQLREKYSHLVLVWPALRQILTEYEDLLCQVCIFSPNAGKKFAPEKTSQQEHFPHSGQVLWFISLNLFLCLHLEISSFLWFRRLFPWCSIINSFSFKHK